MSSSRDHERRREADDDEDSREASRRRETSRHERHRHDDDYHRSRDGRKSDGATSRHRHHRSERREEATDDGYVVDSDRRGQDRHRRHKERKRQRSASLSSSGSSSASSASDTSSSSSSSRQARRDHDSSGRANDEKSRIKDPHPKLVSFGAATLGPDDYYSHSAPFRHWLALRSGTATEDDRRGSRSDKDAKRRRRPEAAAGPLRLDSLSSKEAHRLFDTKFVPRWNAGRLSDDYYKGRITAATVAAVIQEQEAAAGLGSGSGSSGKGRDHGSAAPPRRWAFTATRTAKEEEMLSSTRDMVDSLTNGQSRGAMEMRAMERRKSGRSVNHADAVSSGGELGPPPPPSASASGPSLRIIGPEGGPSGSSRHYTDSRLDREDREEADRGHARSQRRAERRDARERAEELAPRSTGRDAMIEKRQERNRNNREFEASRAGGDGLGEYDEKDLLGEGGSFREALAARDATRQRSGFAGSSSSSASAASKNPQAARRAAREQERQEETQQKRQEFRAKEDATREMLRKLAQDRFG